MIIGWIIEGLLVILSIVLLSGKGGLLISGYNTSTREQKIRYDKKKLCRAIGSMMLLVALATALLFLFIELSVFILYYTFIYIIIVLASVVFIIYYTNTKCNKVNYDSDTVIRVKVELHKKKNNISYQGESNEYKKSMARFIIVCIVTLVTMLAYAFYSNPSGGSPVYNINNGELKISTIFGETVPLSDVQSVELKDSLPGSIIKTNGLWWRSIQKGEFEADGEKMNIYVDASKPPFIYINATDGLIIINDQTISLTQALYYKLQSDIKN